MKSERRHDLQHNELLEWLNKTFALIKPHANTILIGLILIVGAYAAVQIWSVRTGEKTAMAWDSLFAAMNTGQVTGLDKVSDDYSDNEVGDWARLVSADLRLANACDQLFVNKIEAGQELQKAMENYTAVLEASTHSEVRERATFGLAKTYEAMAGTRQSQGELQKAQQRYQEVLDNWEDGVFAESARRRLDDLNRSSTKEFYDQFAAYDPKPAFDPSAGGVGDLPFDPGSLSPGSAPRDFSDLLGSPGLGGGAKEEDSMEAVEEGVSESDEPSTASDTSNAEPAAEQPAEAAEAEPTEKAEPDPPAAETPEKTESE